MQFQFKDTKKEFQICNADGSILKTYFIDIGEVKTLKSVLKRFDDFGEEIKALEQNQHSEEVIDSILKCETDIVNALLENDFDVLWEECNHNFLAMFQITKALIELVKNAMDESNNDL